MKISRSAVEEATRSFRTAAFPRRAGNSTTETDTPALRRPAARARSAVPSVQPSQPIATRYEAPGSCLAEQVLDARADDLLFVRGRRGSPRRSRPPGAGPPARAAAPRRARQPREPAADRRRYDQTNSASAANASAPASTLIALAAPLASARANACADRAPVHIAPRRGRAPPRPAPGRDRVGEQRETTASAKASGSVAPQDLASRRRNRAPRRRRGVETTGTPVAAASRIFSRVPPPARSGTTATAARASARARRRPRRGTRRRGRRRGRGPRRADRPEIASAGAGPRATERAARPRRGTSGRRPRSGARRGLRRRGPISLRRRLAPKGVSRPGPRRSGTTSGARPAPSAPQRLGVALAKRRRARSRRAPRLPRRRDAGACARANHRDGRRCRGLRRPAPDLRVEVVKVDPDRASGPRAPRARRGRSARRSRRAARAATAAARRDATARSERYSLSEYGASGEKARRAAPRPADPPPRLRDDLGLDARAATLRRTRAPGRGARRPEPGTARASAASRW